MISETRGNNMTDNTTDNFNRPHQDHNPKAQTADPAWTKDQIRLARRTPLAPILRQRGYRLRALPKDNALVEDEKDLVVKEHYWIWESHHMKGNAIDFFMCVECRSFNQTMRILLGHDP